MLGRREKTSDRVVRAARHYPHRRRVNFREYEANSIFRIETPSAEISFLMEDPKTGFASMSSMEGSFAGEFEVVVLGARLLDRSELIVQGTIIQDLGLYLVVPHEEDPCRVVRLVKHCFVNSEQIF